MWTKIRRKGESLRYCHVRNVTVNWTWANKTAGFVLYDTSVCSVVFIESVPWGCQPLLPSHAVPICHCQSWQWIMLLSQRLECKWLNEQFYTSQHQKSESSQQCLQTNFEPLGMNVIVWQASHSPRHPNGKLLQVNNQLLTGLTFWPDKAKISDV